MSVFSRLFKVGEAKANEVIAKLEKPELMLNQAILDKEKMIAEAHEKVQAVIATERQSKAALDREEKSSSLWEERAQQALQNGNEDLATKALVRSESHKQNSKGLSPSWQLQRRSVETLKLELRRMNEELDEIKRNKDIIIAQAKTAEVKKSIYEAKASMTNKDKSRDLITRMREKAQRLSYEAEAAEELSESSNGDSLETEFEKLGPAADSGIKAKLEAMKAKLAK